MALNPGFEPIAFLFFKYFLSFSPVIADFTPPVLYKSQQGEWRPASEAIKDDVEKTSKWDAVTGTFI